MSGSVFELLAGGFPFERTVVTLDSLTPVDQAFKTLADAHVSSAPVFDQQANAYIGFFDINDMVAYVVKMLHHSGDAAPLPESFRDMHHFLSTLTHFVPVEVAQIANLSKNNPFLPVYDDTPFLEVLEILGRHAVHRVPVVDRASGRVTRLITQSAVVKYLAKNLNELQPLSENTVASTSLGLKTVFSVACDAPVLQAFETLVANKITGVRFAAGILFFFPSSLKHIYLLLGVSRTVCRVTLIQCGASRFDFFSPGCTCGHDWCDCHCTEQQRSPRPDHWPQVPSEGHHGTPARSKVACTGSKRTPRHCLCASDHPSV
eukprot:m.237970 g.237970  ORF g.237970 m.237970 type:complete len:318 (-) comp54343_c1_seq1:398-1351(-)